MEGEARQGLSHENLFEGVDNSELVGRREPLFESINPHIFILQDWVGNKLGILIAYAEDGDHLDLNTPVVQMVLKTPVDEVLRELDGIESFGKKTGGTVDQRVLDYIDYLREEIQYIVSNIVNPKTQEKEFWNLVNNARAITTLKMIPSKFELDQRKRLAA